MKFVEGYLVYSARIIVIYFFDC